MQKYTLRAIHIVFPIFFAITSTRSNELIFQWNKILPYFETTIRAHPQCFMCLFPQLSTYRVMNLMSMARKYMG